MGLTKKSDGRYVVGKGIADGNEYKGSAAWRDMVIQYSGDSATDKSLEYLTFLKDYALYHSAQGEPVIPPNVQIWMSTANTMKAVEADDITVDGETVKIGACTWDGSDWSFAEPTPGGGGGGTDTAEFNILEDEQTGELYLADSKTIDDIDVAYRSGKQIVMKFLGSPFSFVYYVTGTGHFEGGEFYNPIAIMNPDGETLDSLDFEIVMMNGAGELSVHGISLSGTPW